MQVSGPKKLSVVDLHSQAAAVARHVRGWPKERVLAWLARYGTLKQVLPDDDDLYSFLAPSGLRTGFVLREDGEFFIISTRAVYRLKEGEYYLLGEDAPYPL